MVRVPRELSQDERVALELLAANDQSAVGRRARAILTWEAERDLNRAGDLSGLRPAQVRHWVQAFARLGLRALSPGTSTIGRTGQRPPPRRAAGPPATPAGTPARPRPRGPRLRATDPIVEAFRRILAHHFGKARRLERAAYEANEEAIHDMRVSIRRLRAALRIARPFFRQKRLQGVRTRLQEAAEVLGAVRDLDVILAHAQAYVARQAEGGGEHDGWLEALRSRRAEALTRLQEYLAGKRFRRLGGEVRSFLAEIASQARGGVGGGADVAGSQRAVRVRDVLPAALWSQYSTVRAHEAVAEPTPESLHALRIEIKRLRYLMEFFQGVLGARVVPAIELAVRAQDHLGRLHDAWVAAGMLRAHLGEAGSPDSSALAGAAAYLVDLHREVETLTKTFPELWQEITGTAFRRRMARLLARV